MLASFTSYKKPLTKEDEKEEFDALYQLLQSMVKPSDASPSHVSPMNEKNEVIEPLIIKEETTELKEEHKNEISPLETPKHEQIISSIIKDDESSTKPATESLDVFEIYKYIRPRGRPKGAKTGCIEIKKDKRKYIRKIKKEKHDSESVTEHVQPDHSQEENALQPIVHPIEMPKSMKVPLPKTPLHSNSIICKSCLTSFSKNTDYLLHLNTSDICMKILIEPVHYQPRHELTRPLHIIMYEWLSSALTDGKDLLTCRHCHMTFKSIGNINKHLYTSLTCNRMAYIQFKKMVSDY